MEFLFREKLVQRLSFFLIIFLFIGMVDEEPSCRVESVDKVYSAIDIDGLRQMTAELTASAKLYAQFRLFTISKDRDDLEDLPSDIDKLGDFSASDLAVLSALWAFRSQGAGPIDWIRSIRRSDKMLKKALEIDPKDPLVSLIDAQSTFYKPGFAGGGKEEALEKFLDLKKRISNSENCSSMIEEVDIWIWKVTSEIDEEKAKVLHSELIAKDLSAVNRRMLETES